MCSGFGVLMNDVVDWYIGALFWSFVTYGWGLGYWSFVCIFDFVGRLLQMFSWFCCLVNIVWILFLG